MANTRGIRAGRAFVELGVSDKLSAGLRRAQKRLKAFGDGIRAVGTRLTAIGAGVLAPMMAGVRAFAATGSAIDDMSRRTGVSAETLSELGFAAERSGTSLNSLGAALYRMNRRIANAATESGPAVRALHELGIQAKSFAKLDAATQFKLLADRLNAVENPALAAQYAFEILGDNARDLMPLIRRGSAGIAELQAQARDLGLTISGETAADAARLSDAMGTLWRVLRQGVFVIGSALAPLVTELSQRLTRVVVIVNEWVKANKSVVVSAAKIAGIVSLVGLTVIAAGLGIAVLASAFGGLATLVAGVGAALGAILSPIGLVVAAVVGLGVAVVRHSDIGGQALAWLMDRFGELRAFIGRVVGGITDALAAGDIALAAEVLWLGLKVAWQRGVAELNAVWLEARAFFVGTAQKMWFGALASAQIVLHALESAWIETTAFLSKTWTRFASGFQRIWQSAVGFVAKRMLEIQGLFDSSLDVEAAKKSVDDQLEAKLAEIDAKAQRELTAREDRRRRERDAATELNEATFAEIGRRFEEAQEALRTGNEARIAESQRALDEARRKLDEAIETARERREAMDGEPGPRRIGRDLSAELEDHLGSLGSSLSRGPSARGTFNARAVQGLASEGSVAERTAKATEQTAKHTRQLADAARSGGLTFA